MPSKHRTHGNFGDKSTFKRISNDYYNCAVDISNNIPLPATALELQPIWINYKIALLYDKHNMDALQATKDMCDSYYTIMSGDLCEWDCTAKTRFLYKNGMIKTTEPYGNG